MRFTALSLILLAGCGPSEAELQQAYNTALQIYEKESKALDELKAEDKQREEKIHQQAERKFMGELDERYIQIEQDSFNNMAPLMSTAERMKEMQKLLELSDKRLERLRELKQVMENTDSEYNRGISARCAVLPTKKAIAEQSEKVKRAKAMLEKADAALPN